MCSLNVRGNTQSKVLFLAAGPKCGIASPKPQEWATKSTSWQFRSETRGRRLGGAGGCRETGAGLYNSKEHSKNTSSMG